MELKFLLLTLLVLFAAFGNIETKGRGRGSSSRGSSSRGSSSRGSSSSSRGSYSSGRGSSSSGWGSSSHGSSYNSGSSGRGTSSNSWGSSRPSSSSGWGSSPSGGSTNSHGTSSRNTGSFLNAERGHGSSTGNSNSRSPNRPFGTVPPPKNTGTNNQYRPFGTVPPPKQTSNTGNSNAGSRFKPFATVPPIRNTGTVRPPAPPPGFILPGSVGHTRPTAPSITHPGTVKPAPPPPGFILPGSVGHTRPTAPPITHPATRPGSNHGRYNSSAGSFPPVTSINRPPITRPPTGTVGHHGSNSGRYNGSTGFPTGPKYPVQPPFNPSFPVQQTHHPTQGANPGGSMHGSNYPQQPPFNPSYPNVAPPFYSPYPGHQPTHGYVQQGHAPQVYPQYTHSLPPNPAQTVVIVPGQSNGYQRSTGDIFKEAIIHAGVNAAVNRITSPHHYYDRPGSSWNNYGNPPPGQNTVTSTNTQITNNNFYGDAGNTGSGSNVPPNINAQPIPSGGVPPIGSTNSFNTMGNAGATGNPGNPGNFGNPGSLGSQGSVVSQVPSNGQSNPSQNNGKEQAYTPIWDQDLLNITEKLFSLDENNATRFISLNLQKKVEANNTNITDESPQPLLFVQPEAYNIPTIIAIRSLYEAAAEIENKTRVNSRKEEAFFIDTILNTNVMIAAMDFLARKNLISNDYYEHKDMLEHLWFTPYDGSSSGFKRIFQGESWEGILWGIQDWIAFDFYEKAGRANYLSYVQKTDIGKSLPNASILKANFEMSGTQKTGTALFVGTSPELQLALYTICHYTRPNNYCDVSLGGTRFKIYTHMDRYFGKDLINVAFPIV